jgi:hypothetical protein
VVFDYTAYNEQGRRIDTTYTKGAPARTRLGIQGLIPGAAPRGCASDKPGGAQSAETLLRARIVRQTSGRLEDVDGCNAYSGWGSPPGQSSPKQQFSWLVPALAIPTRSCTAGSLQLGSPAVGQASSWAPAGC